MQTRVSIDWLSITYSWDDFNILASQPLNDALSKYIVEALSMPYTGQWQPCSPLQGYGKAIVNKAGVRVNFSRPGSPNGVHVVYSGGTLKVYGWQEILQTSNRLHGRVTRIDIAYDVLDQYIDIMGLYNEVKAGRCITTSKKYSYIEGNSGQTLYIGSRQSERMLRIYDKAAETGSPGHWTRFELEVKGARARQMAHFIVNMGSSTIPGIILDFAEFLLYEWHGECPFNVPPVDVPSIKGKETDTASWLITGVLPSFKRIVPDNSRVAALFTLDGLSVLIEKNLVDKAFASVVLSGIVNLLNEGEIDVCEPD